MKAACGIAALLLSTGTVIAQTNTPAFEVASIKPSVSGNPGTQFGLPGGGRFTATNATARELVRMAFSVQDYQLVGLPDWTKSARFDIEARANENITLSGDPGKPTPVFKMLGSLLTERFQLQTHRETREMPVYALVLARADSTLGPRVTVSTTDCAALFKAAREKAAAGTPLPPTTDRVLCGSRSRPGYIAGGNISINNLAGNLAGILGRMVIDRTGLTEGYDYTVEYRVDAAPATTTVNPDAPSLETALQEQLGLRLESTKAPIEVLVVDHIERPSEN